MMISAPISDSWLAHLMQRLSESIALGLVSSEAHVSLAAARVFVPAHLDAAALKALSDLNPETVSLRDLNAQAPPPLDQWLPRDDLFDEVAHWIDHGCNEIPTPWLFCEAGFSRLGDKVLSQRRHVVYGTNVFLCASLETTTAVELSTLLRQGRSRRLLAGITSCAGNEAKSFRPIVSGLFLCDAFESDSLMVADLRARPATSVVASGGTLNTETKA